MDIKKPADPGGRAGTRGSRGAQLRGYGRCCIGVGDVVHVHKEWEHSNKLGVHQKSFFVLVAMSCTSGSGRKLRRMVGREVSSLVL